LSAITPRVDLFPYTTLFRSPDEAFSLDLRLSVTTANEASKDLDASLEAVIGGVLEGQDAESFIHLTYVDPGSRGGMQPVPRRMRSEEHTSELQSRSDLVCRL